MVEIYDAERDTLLGTLSDEQFEAMAGSLEEESTSDQDYWIDSATIDMLEEDAADPELIGMLRSALGGREGMDIRWARA